MKEFLNKFKPTSYLEIGIDNPDNNFNHIQAKYKTGVDPYAVDNTTECHLWNKNNVEAYIANIDKNARFERMTSDEFFAKELEKKRSRKYDLVFIDGLHLAEQVKKDIKNAMSFLKPNGAIVCHDTLPFSAAEATPNPVPGQPWRGTCWEAIADLRINTSLAIYTITELNCSVILPDVPGIQKYTCKDWPEIQLSYEFFSVYRKELMNEMSEDEF